jgi:hypothetical protein
MRTPHVLHCYPAPIIQDTMMMLKVLAEFYRKLGFIGIRVTYVRRCKRGGVPTTVIRESIFPDDGWVSLTSAK